MSKRKSEQYRGNKNREFVSSRHREPDPLLFIQAHEADVIRGPQGHAAALALEVRGTGEELIIGEGLMKWGGEPDAKTDERGDDTSRRAGCEDEGPPVWVDRYAASL